MAEKKATKKKVAKKKVVTVEGKAGIFQTIAKYSDLEKGEIFKTEAQEVPGGVLIQVTISRRLGGSWSTAVALSFVPGVKIDTGSKDKTKWLFPA